MELSIELRLRSIFLGVTILLAACTHSPTANDAARQPNSLGSSDQDLAPDTDFSTAVGSALVVVSKHPITVVPSEFDSPIADMVYNSEHPLVLNPGDAFVLVGVSNGHLKLEFNYPEIITGSVAVNQFPRGSLQVKARSDLMEDENLADDSDNEFLNTENASLRRGGVRKNSHARASNCALTPHRPGCCLAAVKYWLRDNKYIRADLSDFPGIHGGEATKNLPDSFVSVGPEGRHSPVRGMVCSYVSTLSPADGHVEVYDGVGWYFGLPGHHSLQDDGHHTCIDCKQPRQL